MSASGSARQAPQQPLGPLIGPQLPHRRAGQGRRTGLQSIPMLIDRREGETPAFQQGFLPAASQPPRPAPADRSHSDCSCVPAPAHQCACAAAGPRSSKAAGDRPAPASEVGGHWALKRGGGAAPDPAKRRSNDGTSKPQLTIQRAGPGRGSRRKRSSKKGWLGSRCR